MTRIYRPAAAGKGIIEIIGIYRVPFVEGSLDGLDVFEFVYFVYYLVFLSRKIRGYRIIALYSVQSERIAQTVNRIVVVLRHGVSVFHSAERVFSCAVIGNRNRRASVNYYDSVDVITFSGNDFYNRGRIPGRFPGDYARRIACKHVLRLALYVFVVRGGDFNLIFHNAERRPERDIFHGSDSVSAVNDRSRRISRNGKLHVPGLQIEQIRSVPRKIRRDFQLNFRSVIENCGERGSSFFKQSDYFFR